MRILFLMAALGSLSLGSPADAQGRGHGHGPGRDQDAAFRAMQQGHILPLAAIRARIRVPGAEYIGAELDPSGSVYRLKFMREGDVIWVDVDARTGRPLGFSSR